MREASAQLKTFLASTPTMVKPDLYTIVLSGGAVLRWTSADIPVQANSQVFAPIAGIYDSGVSMRRGVQVDKLSITVQADERHTVNGVPLIEFIHQGGLTGANILIQRAFATDWIDLESNGPVGVITRFSGRFSEIRDGGSTEVTLAAASWLELLDTMVPPDVFQASCLNTVFDAKCGLDRNNFVASASVEAGVADRISMPTTLVAAAGHYNLGAVLFLSGPNAGLRRTIRSQDASGNIKLVSPLPAVPEVGDTMSMWPGCDQAKNTCSGKFNNLIRYRGQPFIPVPETAI